LHLDGFVLDEPTLVNSRILPYVLMAASVLEGRTIRREELLNALRKGMRQRGIGRSTRREYVLRFSAERLLKYVLEEECRAKPTNATRRCLNARLLRRQRANIPDMLEMETFPITRQPQLDRKKVMSYYDSFHYMTKQRDLVWLGPTGCGKSGLATAFLLQAIDRGYRGYFVTFPELF
jgi:DNA replication protein DnaC